MDTWETISFVNASKVRFAILVEIKEKAKTPSQLANLLKFPISRVSFVLKELIEKGLIKCLTPSKRKSKFYIITDAGKVVLSKISELTSV